MIRFKPDLIILSAGFDAHADDPLAQMEVSTECYGAMTQMIVTAADEICGGRLRLEWSSDGRAGLVGRLNRVSYLYAQWRRSLHYCVR